MPAAKQRPRWVVVLAGLMLVAGAHLFFGALTGLRDAGRTPAAIEALMATPPTSPNETLARQVAAAVIAVERAHPDRTRTQAAACMVLAALLLFSVVAIGTGDKRGRITALAAGWVGIGYSVASAALTISIVRGAVLRHLASEAATADAADQVHRAAQAFLVVAPLLVAAIGVSFSVVLLVYFGGRKGRVFYGLAADGVRHPLRGS